MANIPNSRRYRTTGRSASTSGVAAGRSWSKHDSSAAHVEADQPPGGGMWLVGLGLLGLLIAFPVQVVSFLVIALVVAWLARKK